MPVTRTPKDVEVVVIGGRGGHSGVILPWALHSEGIVEPVALPDGTIAKSIEEFKNRQGEFLWHEIKSFMTKSMM